MAKYIIKRILMSILVIFLIATLTFWLARAVPGGPFNRERPLPEKVIENLNRKYNLDLPIGQQYLLFMLNVARFDFGASYSQTETVNEIISTRFPISLELGLWAFTLAILLGIPLGILSALKEQKPADSFIKVLTTLLISIPNFVIAALMMYYLGVKYQVLPVAMWGTWKHAVMPTVALMAYPLATITKYMRASMLEVLDADYVRTAKAKGASSFLVTYKHALKNALLPVLTVSGPMFVNIICGSFVVEQLFAVPGLGQMFVKGVLGRDYAMIMGLTVFYAIILIAMLLLVDILYVFVDPRIKVDQNKSTQGV